MMRPTIIPASEEVDCFLTKISEKLLSVDADVNIGDAYTNYNYTKKNLQYELTITPIKR